MNEEQKFFWLVGLLEGEGSFICSSKSLTIQLRMTKDEDTMTRAAIILGAKLRKYSARKLEYNDVYYLALNGTPAKIWMERLLPYMSARRQEQIKISIERNKSFPGTPRGESHGMAKLNNEDVKRIRELVLEGRSVSSIAELFDMSYEHIRRITTGKIWTHVL